ncbi:MAG TPA: methyltransferase domain-containing protein [Acidimicrobiales bacterium]|nr:methyltransferase domain-containing protein [Acidimicrobiales bacterium]
MAETLVATARLRVEDGRVLDLDVRRWLACADDVDEALLDLAVGPVLDVGCGPGRLVRALGHRGISALGVEVAPTAVALARSWGAPVLQRSIFDHLPRRGRWRSALLLDGSVGIGGDPVALLRRVAELLSPDGRLLIEMEEPGLRSESLTVRIETARGAGPWFAWSVVAVDDASVLAAATGFELLETWTQGGRWFVRMDRSQRRT